MDITLAHMGSVWIPNSPFDHYELFSMKKLKELLLASGLMHDEIADYVTHNLSFEDNFALFNDDDED